MPARLAAVIVVGIVQALSGVAAFATIAIPTAVTSDEFTLLFRAVISGSLMLNLFFLRGVYKRINVVDKHSRRIGNIETAVKLLAREATHFSNTEHGGRKSDGVILSLIELLEQEDKDTP